MSQTVSSIPISFQGCALQNNCYHRALVGFHDQFTATLAGGVCPRIFDLIKRIVMLIPAVLVYLFLALAMSYSPIISTTAGATQTAFPTPPVVFTAAASAPVQEMNAFLDSVLQSQTSPCLMHIDFSSKGINLQQRLLFIPQMNHPKIDHLKNMIQYQYTKGAWSIKIAIISQENGKFQIKHFDQGRNKNNALDYGKSSGTLNDPSALQGFKNDPDFTNFIAILPNDWPKMLKNPSLYQNW